jgi:transcriptional regulator with XRE-family HTH domain
LNLKFPVAAIARATGYSKSNVSDYLSGKKSPSENFLKAFYKFYYPQSSGTNEHVLNDAEALYKSKDDLINALRLTVEAQKITIMSLEQRIDDLMRHTRSKRSA